MKRFKLIFVSLLVVAVFANTMLPVKAESLVNLKDVQMLLDMVTSAAYSSEESQSESLSGTGIDQSFVNGFLKAAAHYLHDESLLTDNAAQEALLKSVFTDNLEAIGETAPLKISNYVGVKVMTYKTLENGNISVIGTIYVADNAIDQLSITQLTKVNWLDRRIVITLQPDDASSYRYKVVDYSLNGELQVEAELNDYFVTHLIDYVNTRMGFSFQYPSVFEEKSIKESDDGISANNGDGTATMSVSAFANTENWTANTFYQTSTKSQKNATVKMYEDTNMVSVFTAIDNEKLSYSLYLFTEQNVFQVTYTYVKDLAADFGLFIQYLHNTFHLLSTEIG